MINQSGSDKLLWINIPGSKGLKIKCLLNGELNGCVAVLMHGKPGKPDGLTQKQTVKFLNDHGITCLRPFLYSPDPNTRNLADCSLDTYSQDFDTIVSYLRQYKPKKVFAIGHSYGGLAVLKSNSKVDAAVLWEPTHGSFWVEYMGSKDRSSKPLTDYEALGDTTLMAAHKGYPLMIISGGRGKMTKYHERYVGVADEPKSHVVIGGARHNFGDSVEVINELRHQTAQWLCKYM